MSVQTAEEIKSAIEREYDSKVTYAKIGEALGLKRVRKDTPIDQPIAVIAKALKLKKPKGSSSPAAAADDQTGSTASASASGGVKASEMARMVTLHTQPFRISVKEIGQAIKRPRLKNNDLVTEDVETVLAKLKELKPAMWDTLERAPEVDVEEVTAGELLPYTGSPFDEKVRVQVQGIIDHFKAVVEAQDGPYRPKVARSRSGTGFNFPNPFTGEEQFLSVEHYTRLRDDPTRSFPMDQKPVRRDMAQLVAQMSVVTTTCVMCGDDIFPDELLLEDKMGLLLKERFFLPGTPDLPPGAETISFPGSCGVCRDVRRAVVDLEVKLQDKPGKEAQAERAQTIVDTAVAIYERHADRRPDLSARIVGERLQALAVGGGSK